MRDARRRAAGRSGAERDRDWITWIAGGATILLALALMFTILYVLWSGCC